MSGDTILEQLMMIIEDRKLKRPENSYTTELLAGGVERIGAKIVEEAAEVVAAATETGPTGRGHLIHESADLLFHLLVVLGYRDIRLSEVEAELARRMGSSGLGE